MVSKRERGIGFYDEKGGIFVFLGIQKEFNGLVL